MNKDIQVGNNPLSEQDERALDALIAKQAEYLERARKREEWIKAHTCEHCRQHPPIPPRLL